MEDQESHAPPRSGSRSPAAPLFLLALVAVPLLGALLWDRLSSPTPAPPVTGPVSMAPNMDRGIDFRLKADERSFLLRLFLETLRNPDQEQPPGNTPPICRKPLQATVFATVYAPGRENLRKRARERTLIESVRRLAQDLRESSEYRRRGFSEASDLRARIDVITGETPLSVTRRQQFAGIGIGRPHGVALRDPDKPGIFLPDDFAAHRALNHRQMLNAVCRQGELAPGDWRKSKHGISVLKAESFVSSPSEPEKTISLHRGLPLVTEASAPGVDRALTYLTAFTSRMLTPHSGDFSASYNASTGMRSPGRSVQMHALAVASLARYGQSGTAVEREQMLHACRTALARLVRHVKAFPDDDSIAFVQAGQDASSPSIVATAAVLRAFCEHRRRASDEEWDTLIGRLANFLLLVQDETGRFAPPAAADSGSGGDEQKDERQPAEGLRFAVRQLRGARALGAAFGVLGEPGHLLGTQRAVEAVRENPALLEHPRAGRLFNLAIWELSDDLPTSRYLALVSRATSPLLTRQIADQDAPAPDLAGGALRAFPPDTTATAADMGAFMAAWMLNERNGEAADKYFAGRCRRSARRAARFLLQFQFDRESSYYVAQPSDALGGIRRRPGSNMALLQTSHRAVEALGLFSRVFPETSDEHDPQSEN